MISVSIDRTELELDPLVISDYPPAEGGLYLDEGGITEPDFEIRVVLAPESVYMPGQLALAAVTDAGGLGLKVYATADSTAALSAFKAELRAALNQWRAEITTTIDGEDVAYTAVQPVNPHWGPLDSGMVRAFLAKTSVTVVVNPPTGA